MNKTDVVQVDFEKWVEEKYKEYSLYVCQKRALPHLVDGLKPSQRKIIFTALRRATKFIKVVSLSGYGLAEASYHHGDASLSDAISLMGKDYVGSNNYPLLEGDGGFGNVFGASPSAPRYIYVRNSKFQEKLFLREDDNILTPSDDVEDPEPSFYLPVLPYALLNGISGIAVGFSVDIPAYSPQDIIKIMKDIIKKGKPAKNSELSPFYKGYTGEIKKIDDDWYMYGKFKRINTTTIDITEIPINTKSEDYKKHLNNLIEKDIIKDYDELSDSKWHFVIRAPRVFGSQTDEAIYSQLNLKVKIQERINVVYNNVVKEYGNNPIDLIVDFMKIRLTYYDKRKVFKLETYRDGIIKNFIKMIVNKYVIKSKTIIVKKDILDFIKTKENKIYTYLSKELNGGSDISTEYFDELNNYVIDNLKLSDVYNDKLETYQNNIADITNKYNELYNTKPSDLYLVDIDELEKFIKKEGI